MLTLDVILSEMYQYTLFFRAEILPSDMRTYLPYNEEFFLTATEVHSYETFSFSRVQ